MEAKEVLKRSYQLNAPFEIREGENGTKILTGKPIVFNQRTDMYWFEEVIERGALNGTDLSDVRFLVNHDTSKIPLARHRASEPNSTMSLKIEDDGLSVTIVLDVENNNEARALYSAVLRGDISGMSFMFSIADEEWENLDSDYPTRRIKSIAVVFEVSAVTFPAYEGTEISARNKDDLENAKEVLSKAKEKEPKPEKRDFKTAALIRMYTKK